MLKTKRRFIDFKEVKEQISIEQVLESYGVLANLSGSGNQRSGPCPIHGGGAKSRSFSANFTKNCWNCFGDCDRGGNVLDFVAVMEECSLRDAAIKIVDQFGLETKTAAKKDTPRQSKRQEAQQSPKKAKKEVASETGEKVGSDETGEESAAAENRPLTFQVLKNLEHDHEELVGRGLMSDTAEHFGIGYCTRGLLKGRVAIPIHDREGHTLAYAGTALDGEDEPYFYPENFVRGIEVYNVHRAVESERVERVGYTVVTDYLQVVDLFEARTDNVVALVDAVVSNRQLEILASLPNPTGAFVLTVGPADTNAERIAGRLARIGFVQIMTVSSLSSPEKRCSEIEQQIAMDAPL